MKFIGHVLLRAAILVIAFDLALHLPGVAGGRTFTLGWRQENYAKVQSYAAAPPRPEVVVVGTSLTARLPVERFSFPARNLSLVGSSALTGLESITRSGKLPVAVVIETNLLDRGPDQPLLADCFDPIPAALRRRVRALEEANQPANVGARLIDRYVVRLADASVATSDPQFFELRLQVNLRAENVPPNLVAIRNVVREVNTLATALHARGVRIFLMESPAHPAYRATPHQQAVRATVAAEMDSRVCEWLPADPRSTELPTTDGCHLTPDGMNAYAAFLDAELAARLKRPAR